MKTKFITSVVSIVFASASLFAADPAATVELVNQKGSSIYKVVYKAPGTGKAFLKITGNAGVVFSETLTFTNGFTLPLDFKGMAAGEYTVEVLSKGTKFKQTVAYEKATPVAYVRVTEQAGAKQLLTITSQVPADFTIRIYDNLNNELFVKTETVKSDYAVVFNMSQVSGSYRFDVTETPGNVKVIRK